MILVTLSGTLLGMVSVLTPIAPRGCPTCNGQAVATAEHLGTLEVTLGHVRGIGPERYDLVCCPSCELIFLSPLPPQKVFDTLYLYSPQFDCPDYQGDQANRVVENHRLWLHALLTRLPISHKPNRWLRALLRRLKIRRRPNRMLEIGSGLSWMSRAAKFFSDQTTTVAQDISSEAAESCPWVDHFLVGPLDSKNEEIQALGPYDVISMSHVIEHLPDPVHVLRLCSTWLDRKGIIFLAAPSRPVGWIASASSEVWKSWKLNHTPAHLQYFNERSMERCALKSGLRLVNYEADKDAFIAWLGLGSEKRNCEHPVPEDQLRRDIGR